MCLTFTNIIHNFENNSNKVLGGSVFQFCALLNNGEGKKWVWRFCVYWGQGEWCAEDGRGQSRWGKEGKVSALQMKNGLFTWAKVWTPKTYNSSHFLLTGPDRFYMFRFSSIFIVQLLQRTLNYRKYSDGLYMDNILLVLYCWLGFLWLKPKLINFLLLSKHQSLYLTVDKCQSFFLLQTFHLFQRLCVHI